MWWMSILCSLKKNKLPGKTQKKTTETKGKNIKMSAKGGPLFTFSLPAREGCSPYW